MKRGKSEEDEEERKKMQRKRKKVEGRPDRWRSRRGRRNGK